MKYILTVLVGIFIISCNNNYRVDDHLNLNNKLAGKWKAKAFDGELHEEWKLSNDGWMQQQGYYIEKSDTSYSARTRIEKVGEEIILVSVIKNSNPKIFQATTSSENEIIFENNDYKNPFQVTYEFLSAKNYRRTIKGYEKDSLVTYVFDFSKIIEQINH